MIPNLRERTNQPELMDTKTFPLPTMKRVLGFLKITNIFFGGNKTVLSKLNKWKENWFENQTIHILDVGTGGGDIPIAIAKWAKRKKLKIKITGIDLVPEIVDIAKKNTKKFPNIHIQKKDVWELVAKEEKFDYVIASLFLHHIPPEKNSDILKNLDSICRRGLIISDLLRSYSSYLSISFISHLIGNRVVRYDGPLSVRRAFKLNELKDLRKQSGLVYLEAKKEPWFRVSLSGEKQ